MANDLTPVQILETFRNIPSLAGMIWAIRAATPESPLVYERQETSGHSADLELIKYLNDRARACLETAEDAFRGLTRVLEPPPLLTSPGGVARNVLEPSALCLWLTDPTSSLAQRLQRAAWIWRYDLGQDLRLANAGLEEDPTRVELREAVHFATAQQQRLDILCTASGIPNGAVPTSTSLSQQFLEQGYEYRLWSALSHANPTAIHAVRAMWAGDEPLPASAYLGFMHGPIDAYLRAVYSYMWYITRNPSPDFLDKLLAAYRNVGFKDEVIPSFIAEHED